MTDQTYAVLIDKQPFKSKPTPQQIPSINSRIASQSVEVTQQEFANLVGENGQTTVLATMDGKRAKNNMVQQQVVALDFDNTKIVDGKKVKTEGDEYTTVAEIFQDTWVQQNASFIYSTFNHTKEWHRFRLVMFLDRAMTNNNQVEKMYEWLMDKFPTADKANKDSSRLFFGGTEYVEINFANELDTSQVTFKKEKKMSKATTKKVAPLNNDEAIAGFERYIEKDKENLQEYNHALSAIWVIARAAIIGEISYPSAYVFAEMLALGNEEWEKENEIKLKEALNTPLHDFHTEYSFAEKFLGQSTPVGATLDATDMIATSKYLVDTLDIKLFNNQLYFKNGNHWISDNNKLLRAVDQYIELLHSRDNELMNQFMKRAELIEDEFFPVQLRNDYYIENGEVKEGRAKGFTPYYLDVNYEPTMHNQDVDEFLDFLTLNRLDLRNVVEDMLGHILMRKGFPHKVFFFIGEKGANGKSTFLEMLNSFVGDLGTNISLENFNDATSVVELEGKLVNVGDDIDVNYLESSSNFKILASGNTLMVRPIYATPYRMKNKATLIFTANGMPTFKDKSGGIARRLIIIPCDNEVKKVDFEIDEKLSTDEAKSYLLNLALKGLRRIQTNGGSISESETINRLVQQYLTESNNMLQFLSEIGINEDLTDSQNYEEYQKFCDEHGVKPYKKTAFTQEVKKEGYEHVRQMRLRKRNFYYIKIDEK